MLYIPVFTALTLFLNSINDSYIKHSYNSSMQEFFEKFHLLESNCLKAQELNDSLRTDVAEAGFISFLVNATYPDVLNWFGFSLSIGAIRISIFRIIVWEVHSKQRLQRCICGRKCEEVLCVKEPSDRYRSFQALITKTASMCSRSRQVAVLSGYYWDLTVILNTLRLRLGVNAAIFHFSCHLQYVIVH